MAGTKYVLSRINMYLTHLIFIITHNIREMLLLAPFYNKETKAPNG